VRQNCNCQSCLGEGPPDDEAPEFTDDFAEEWIDDHKETVKELCGDKIQEAYEKWLSGALEDAAISRADAMADSET
jgi:hypothetical protein